MSLVDSAQEQNALAFEQELKAALAEKVGAAIDAKKIEVAQSMFTTNESVGHIEKGAFHRWLGKSEDEPITHADIEKGIKAGGHAEKMALFAQNFGHV
jgi:hypothetical protein